MIFSIVRLRFTNFGALGAGSPMIHEKWIVGPQGCEIDYRLFEQLCSLDHSEQLSSSNPYAISNSRGSTACYQEIHEIIPGALISVNLSIEIEKIDIFPSKIDTH